MRVIIKMAFMGSVDKSVFYENTKQWKTKGLKTG